MLAGAWLLTSALPALGATTAELTTKPTQPEAGENVLVIKLRDAAGNPVDGAKVSVDVHMPAMGTMPRMDEKTVVEPRGGGVYDATFDLPMGGTWEITLTVEKDGAKDVSHHSLTTGIPGVTSRSSGRARGRGAETEATNLMELGPERLQKIGVRFAEAKVTSMRRDVEAVGVVEQDQTHREEVTLRFPGYVVKQFRGRIGDLVKAGEPLFSVYSPDLVTAQSELLLAEKIANGPSLHHAASEKLKNLGLSEREIAHIRREGRPNRDVIIRSSISGTILDIAVREGASVAAGQVTYVIGDLSKAFVVARVFQQDVGDLRVGQAADVMLPGGSAKPLAGTIDLICPQVEQGAGTANVRVVVNQFSPGLRPGVYVDVRFPVELGSLLSIPAEAVLYSGRHRYVFVDRGGGGLEPREVGVGTQSDGMLEVRDGLSPGERVVASGTFLLGSEAQLRSALPKWKEDGMATESAAEQGSNASGVAVKATAPGQKAGDGQ
jgi:Cu(I)/Ag(I) efflux system membrane fusion protein